MSPPSLSNWPTITEACAPIERRLIEASSAYTRAPWACFGNEAKAAHILAFSESAAQIPYQRFFFRPSFEPVALGAWAPLSSGTIDMQVAGYLVNALGTGSSRPRESDAFGTARSDGTAAHYPSASIAAGWLARLREAQRAGLSKFSMACFEYAEVLLSHPFPDGNGRLARAILHGSLARNLGFNSPFLPLGPSIYKFSNRLIPAIVELGKGQGPEKFIGCMADVVLLGLNISERINQSDQ